MKEIWEYPEYADIYHDGAGAVGTYPNDVDGAST